MALYERGLQALQRHDYRKASADLQAVLERYPQERDLHDRVQLYLRVCERHTHQLSASPTTAQEQVYAATLALNSGAPDQALCHLTAVTQQDPGNDHAHYMTAVAQGLRGNREAMLDHLRRAVELNSENRSLAKQDPDFAAYRSDEGFRKLVESHILALRRRGRIRLAR
ncbi:MAG: hypothetical protein HYX76_13180 [Acidobacteria bacterium]|nr:hypothetical protein [Acidobacteriota bacterium]